jgi:hypothetical protein
MCIYTHILRICLNYEQVLLDASKDKDIAGNLMPNLIYVSRGKCKALPHHFKAGALNALVNKIYASPQSQTFRFIFYIYKRYHRFLHVKIKSFFLSVLNKPFIHLFKCIYVKDRTYNYRKYHNKKINTMIVHC